MAFALNRAGTWWACFASSSGALVQRRVGPVVSWRRWQVERIAEELRVVSERFVPEAVR